MYKVICILLLFCHTDAFACTCVRGIDLKYSYEHSDIVVKARIIESKYLENILENENGTKTIELNGTMFRAIVSQQYKGVKTADTIDIKSGNSSADCGIWLQEGEHYIIYIKSEAKKINYTGMCSGTKLYSKKEHRQLLKLSRKQAQ